MLLYLLIFAADSGAGSASGASLDIDFMMILQIVRNLAVVISMLVGIGFVLAGTIGVLRLPDFFSRIHAAGMTDTLGAELIILGLVIQAGFSQLSLKLLMVAFFLLLTSPTSTHAVANAAYKSGLKPKLGKYRVKSTSEITDEAET